MKDVYTEEREEKGKAFDRQNVFGKGVRNINYEKYFVGLSYVKPLTQEGSLFPCLM